MACVQCAAVLAGDQNYRTEERGNCGLCAERLAGCAVTNWKTETPHSEDSKGHACHRTRHNVVWDHGAHGIVIGQGFGAESVESACIHRHGQLRGACRVLPNAKLI